MIQITKFLPATVEVTMTFECNTIEEARELFNEGEFDMEFGEVYDADFDMIDCDEHWKNEE